MLLLTLVFLASPPAEQLPEGLVKLEQTLVRALALPFPQGWSNGRIGPEDWEAHCPGVAASFKAPDETAAARLDHLWRKAGMEFAQCSRFPWAKAKRVWDDRRPPKADDEGKCGAGVKRYRPFSVFYEAGDQTWVMRYLHLYGLPDGRYVLGKPPRCRKKDPARVVIARKHRYANCVCDDAVCLERAKAAYVRALGITEARPATEPEKAKIAEELEKARACAAKLLGR